MKVINIFGGPGSGKSTGAASLYAWLKRNGESVELIQEYAKELYYEGTLATVNELQIFNEQVRRLETYKGKVDYVITDAPLLKSVVYARNSSMSIHEYRSFIRYVDVVFHKYCNINLFLIRPGDQCLDHNSVYDQRGRLQGLAQAINLDRMLKRELSRVDPTHLIVPGNEYLPSAKVVEYIRSHG